MRAARELRHQSLRRGLTRLSDDIEAFAVWPALAFSGARVQLIARRPDGSREILLVIPRYDREAQVTYRFRTPVTLPQGSAIDVTSFDPDTHVDLAYVRSARRSYSGLTDTVKGATNTAPAR